MTTPTDSLRAAISVARELGLVSTASAARLLADLATGRADTSLDDVAARVEMPVTQLQALVSLAQGTSTSPTRPGPARRHGPAAGDATTAPAAAPRAAGPPRPLSTRGPTSDASLARRVVDMGLVSRDDLARCQAACAAVDPPRPLIQQLLIFGLLGADELGGLLRAQDAAEGTRRIGRYEIVGELGRGGMGTVFDAVDPDLRRPVALKVIHAGADAGMLGARLVREARLASRLAHPGIVGIHEVGHWEDPQGVTLPYIAMERIDGTSLHEALPDSTLAEGVALLAQVAEAVGHAHEQGVVHRDLKPANILVTPAGRAVVTDFGLARAESDCTALTRSGAVLGTASYMAPEQVEGDLEAISGHTDVWALGVMLYQLLTGSLPFPGRTPAEVYQRILRLDPMSPRALVGPEVPIELEAICFRALERDPARRYPDGAAVAAELRAWERGDAVVARPPSLGVRSARWLHRHRVVAGMVGVAVLTVASAIGVVGWRAHRARRTADAALLSRAASLRSELARREARRSERTGPAAPRLLRAGGDADPTAVRAWYEAHEQVLGTLDQLARLAEQAASPEVAARIAVDVDARRRALCGQVWRQAAGLGDYHLARSWVGRASHAGLGHAERAVALGWISAQRDAATRTALDACRQLLVSARRPPANDPDWFERSLGRIVRRGQPALVRLLLTPIHLDSRHPWERRLAWAALGRIGDTRTRPTAGGADPVEALVARLAKIDLRREAPDAAALARALGFLRDGRARAVLARRRWDVPQQSLFWRQAQAALAQLPLSADDDRAPTVGVWIDRGLTHQDRGDLKAARAAFDRALALDTRSAVAYLSRANLFATQGERAAALADYDRALECNPDLLAARLGRGSVRAQLGQAEGALADLDRAIAQDPRHAMARYLRALSLDRLGRPDDALAAFGAALEIDNGLVPALVSRGDLRARRGDDAGALVDYGQAIDLEPQVFRAFHGRARVRMRRGNLAGARLDLDSALRLAPTYYPAICDRARLLERLGDLPGAIASWDRAVELQPGEARVWSNRGTVRGRHGDLAGAVADLRKAVSLDASLFSGWVNLGIGLRQQGDHAGALQAFERALRLASADQRPRLQSYVAQTRRALGR